MPLEPSSSSATCAPLSFRWLTTRYVVGLLLVAALAGGGYLFFQRLVDVQRTSAELVNVSGRQRMLSQRILSCALQAAATINQDTRASDVLALREAIADMEASDRWLLDRGGSGQGIMDDFVLSVWRDAPWKLEKRLAHFLADAKAVAAAAEAAPLSLDDAHLFTLVDLGHYAVLSGADEVVRRLQINSELKIAELHQSGKGLLAVILVLLLVEAGVIFHPMVRTICASQAALREANDRLEREATTDPLTGAYNRRKFRDTMPFEMARMQRFGGPMALLLFDIDHFKKVNDTHGHDMGDQVLKELVAVVRETIRKVDYVFRWGGEEFIVAALYTPPDDALALAEKLRAAVEGYPFCGGAIRATISIGVSSVPVGPFENVEKAVAEADERLYEAKRGGRNRVVGQTMAG
ncbi:MAG: diguanylate cyclase [Desulfovibrionaceae bacterium]